MIFWKYQALGNDFIIIDSTSKSVDLLSSEIALLCNRNFGVGSDGLMILQKGEIAPYIMSFYNPDGSRAEMCGNGIRCLALYIHDYHDKLSKKISIQTDAGIRVVDLKKAAKFQATVAMGKPNFYFNSIPAEPTAIESVQKIIKKLDSEFSIVLTSIGNPHCVIFLKNTDVDSIDLTKYGKSIENNPDFPNKINVEFCNLLDRKKIKVRVWERGVGETTACGTGACAVAAAAIRNELTENDVTIELPGGNLMLSWNMENDIYLTGEAIEVFKGDIGLEYVKEMAKR